MRERRTTPTNGAARLALVLCVASALRRTVEASTTLAAVGEACSSDADCYDTNANWCHTDTNLCAVHSDTGEACVTNDHCKNNKACLGGYCCAEISVDWASSSYQRCTACVAMTTASEYFRHYGECTACKADAWLDVSDTQNGFDDRANWDSEWEGVVADFGRCKQTWTADQFQYWDGCEQKKSAGQSCGGSSESERCASGLCGGNYCCDAIAMLPIAAICVIKVPGNASDRRAAITRRAPLRPRTQPRATRPRATQPMWEFPLHRRLRSPLRPRVAVPLTKSPKVIPRLQRRRKRKPRRPATPCSTASRTQS